MNLDDLPRQVAAAGVLITNTSGQTLLVSTPYRDGLVLPGGLIEQDEPPAAAAEREVLDEVGLRVAVTRLLVVQHKPVEAAKPSSLQFVFDSDVVEDGAALRLQAEEINAAYWLDADTAVRRHTLGGQRRMTAAFAARAEGGTTYMDADRTIAS